MSKKIYYHLYSLRSRQPLNVKSKRIEHQGALIRVGDGFGCIHPWEVLGDETLEVQLAELAKGKTTRLSSSALECAEKDGEARRAGMSLFKGVKVPKSHATIVGGIEEVEAAVSLGFDTIKLKMGKETQKDAELINAIAQAHPELKIRADFNCNLLGSEVGDLVERLTTGARTCIDFLEDPCGYKDGCWLGLRKLYGIRLAMDIGVERADGLYSYAVVKPAKNNVKIMMEKARAAARKVVFTSYMDHPIGQAFAAYEAGIAAEKYRGVVDTCGLMTNQLFEQNEFIEELGGAVPEWGYGSGSGLGFDNLLERIDWKLLK